MWVTLAEGRSQNLLLSPLVLSPEQPTVLGRNVIFTVT